MMLIKKSEANEIKHFFHKELRITKFSYAAEVNI